MIDNTSFYKEGDFSTVSQTTMAETYLSVKIREDVYRMVKTLAAWHGKPVGEFLSEIVEPVARKEMSKLSKEAGKRTEPEDTK